jgi:hypothetical protein
MKRSIPVPLAALLGLLALTAGRAPAQFTYPFQPPRYGPGYQTQLSPYLNMLRGGDAAANYFLGVLPEQQRRQDRNRIYGQMQGMMNLLPTPPQVTDRDIFTPLPSSGHLIAYDYTGSYFGGMSQGGGAYLPRNPFPQQQGQGNRWPNNAPQPAGKPPVKPK